jgi:Flp pilus assembly protein TadG
VSISYEDRLLMSAMKNREAGQALAVMVLVVAVVLAATAVVLDGGNAMAQERGTQNATDAAALRQEELSC